MSLRVMYFDGDNVVYLDDATADGILRLIRLLEGQENTVVGVSLENGDNVEIGGGNENQYKVNARVSGKSYDLVSLLSDSFERVPLVTCDDLCYYPKRYIVTLQQTLDAVRHFCLTGTLKPEFAWSNLEDYYPFEPDVQSKDEPPRQK